MLCEWRTKEGQWLPIGAMTDAHVGNCINYISRVGDIGPYNYAKFSPHEWVMIFQSELSRRARLRTA